jgi:hypothetical protein
VKRDALLQDAKSFYRSGGAAILMGAVVSGPVGAAPITFNTALPVSRDRQVVRLQIVHDEAGRSDVRMTTNEAVAVVAYGATSRLALFAVLPYREKKLTTAAGTRENSGVGDIAFIGRYTIFQRDGPGRTFRVAPFLGVETPTGKAQASDPIGLLPPSLQIGSGGWDVFGGAVATFATTRWQADAQISYRTNGAANGFEAGDVFRADASFQRRLAAPDFGGSQAFVYGVLETSIIHRGRNMAFGAPDPNSGGTEFLVAPGLQLAARRWIAEGAVQIPAAQDLNGTALEADLTARAGIRVNF